jgi:hypothetical protein
MEQVTKEKQLKVVTDNKVGRLAEVTALVAEKGVNIDNICAYSCGKEAVMYLLTSDNAKAKKALDGKGFKIDEDEVILLRVWNRPGSLAAVTARLKKHGINIETVYGTSTESGERMTIVFSCEDNNKAVEVFSSMLLEDGEKIV